MDNTGRLAWGLARGKLSGRDTWQPGPELHTDRGHPGPAHTGLQRLW